MSALEQLISAGVEDDQQRQVVDYKMVTFTLGGKDYGVDIMSVKEIYKAQHLTPVPNTAPFVRGVFNLRGEIISIIDLRRMFNLPVMETATEEIEDIIFVKVDDHLVGVVVDFINDVVGLDSSTIQPPHPLFGDINIRYISGVVEYEEKLFIILDTDAIFGSQAASLAAQQPAPETPMRLPETPVAVHVPEEALSYTFITETLSTFKSFEVGDINEDWVRGRFEEWKQIRGGDSAALQLKSEEDADEFLRGFQSYDTGRFWSEETATAFQSALPDISGILFSAWNVGCGSGQEAYSLASILKTRYPDKQLKVWAHDSDLLKVANAPNMVFRQSDLPPWIRIRAVEGSRGWSFTKEISDSILFEYHDVLHENPLPPVNLIVARDILSLLSSDARGRILRDFGEKLVPDGILVVGENERIKSDGWVEQEASGIRWYTKSN